jgi:hypothetical protein
MNRTKKSQLASFLAIGLAAVVSQNEAQSAAIPGSSELINGHPVTAFADVGPGNHLTAVGFQFSGAVVRDPGTDHAAIFLTLPSQASATVFTVLQFDWVPEGHEPMGVYDLPHFDLHFYYISNADRMAIPANQTFEVAPQFLATNYSQPGPTVPMMGGHALDLTGAEFNGGTFTQTFIYGFHNGQQIFVEPMLTQEYLKNLSGSNRFPIRQPGKYALASLPALIPGSVQHSYDSANDLYTVSVGNFLDPAALPEPGSALLFALGIPAVLWAGARRTRRKRE